MQRSMLVLLTMPVFAFTATVSGAFDTDSLNLPDGFRIEVVAEVPNARSMVFGDAGTLFVATRSNGKVYAVTDVLGPEPVVTAVTAKLRFPNGVAFADGDLYVAEPNRLLRYPSIETNLDVVGEPELVVDDLPGKKLHAWKYIAFGPDGKLYVAVGAPCNVCDAPGYGLILRMKSNGDDREVVAEGIRNSVGMAWQPGSEALWFTDNNRDMLGDDEPPGELNALWQEGAHFGFPFCHGADVVEPEAELAKLGSCADSQPPELELPAHVAALGLVFYTGDMFPDEYHNQIFIAEHGSWNRSEKVGYRVSLVTLDEPGRQVVGYQPFVEGWLRDDDVQGRPVDVLVAPDGSLLISDDQGGRIYRVTYSGSGAN